MYGFENGVWFLILFVYSIWPLKFENVENIECLGKFENNLVNDWYSHRKLKWQCEKKHTHHTNLSSVLTLCLRLTTYWDTEEDIWCLWILTSFIGNGNGNNSLPCYDYLIKIININNCDFWRHFFVKWFVKHSTKHFSK